MRQLCVQDWAQLAESEKQKWYDTVAQATMEPVDDPNAKMESSKTTWKPVGRKLTKTQMAKIGKAMLEAADNASATSVAKRITIPQAAVQNLALDASRMLDSDDKKSIAAVRASANLSRRNSRALKSNSDVHVTPTKSVGRTRKFMDDDELFASVEKHCKPSSRF